MLRGRLVHSATGEDGFTLVELMIVMVVLGILAGIVILGISNLRADSEASRDDANAHICKTARAASAVKHAGDDSFWADYLEPGATCPP